MTWQHLTWLILFLPLLSAIGIALFTRRMPGLSAALSVGAIAGSFVLALAAFALMGGGDWVPVELSVTWLQAGNLHIDFGIQLDRLGMVMLLIVTGVGLLIHIYSCGYMRGDPGYSRYFASMSLFTFSMLGIVLSNNFIQMFIFWELVGLSSYLLIGFWFDRPAPGDAAKKAFLTNRVGDFGFLLGILIVWNGLGSLNFIELKSILAANPGALGAMATAAGLLIFCGAAGKSAQFPLHVWLPDAMEGPTPVSALIHAATMVAAGVYMLCRVLFLMSPAALEVVAWIGGFTALIAALIAVQQNDIKRILAYSTMSQLGYMVMAVGTGSGDAAMFHLTTHAFFKALLFLGAGSVIHALHHEQDIWRMGELKHRMPVTYWTFLLGTLALCGVPPFSGFFSKDTILVAAFEHNGLLFAVAVGVAVLTTFYMFRLFLVAFHGPRKTEAVQEVSESPRVMTVPLVLLAVPAVLGGLIGIDAFLAPFFDGHAAHESWWSAILHPFNHAPAPAFLGLLAVLIGLALALGLYSNATSDPLPDAAGFICGLFRNRFYLDEIYQWLIRCTQDALAALADSIDRWIISGLLVRGTHGAAELAGRALRMVQTGNLQTYAFLFVLGVAVMLFLVLN